MKRNTKKRMRKQKKYQIRRDVKKQRAEHVVDCLHLPKDVVMGAELTQLSGNSEMQVRNFKKLISCQENEICIQTGRHRIRITGRCLAMAYFTSEEVKVTGCITSICYEE